MSDSAERARELLDHAVRAGEPEQALRALDALRTELDALERVQVWRALDAGGSYGTVARALGISRQAAHRRYRALAGASPPGTVPRVTPEARAAAQLAGEEAQRLGALALGSEHLLLGVLRTGGPAAEALRAAGITLDAARMQAQPTLVHGRPRPNHGALTAYAREVFATASRMARGTVGVEHLVLAALEEPDGGACRTVEALGVDPATVRGALAA